MSICFNLPSGYRAAVVGATGGIGSAFVELIRRDERCSDLISLGRSLENKLDITDERSIALSVKAVAERGPVHLIVIATGILSDTGKSPEKALRQLDGDHLAKLYAVNAIGPLMVIKHYAELMPRKERGVIAAISARVGSISDNRLGGWYSYRMSKAALNMGIKTAAVEIARIRPNAVCLALHPGTVATPLSDPFSRGRSRLDPLTSAESMLGVINAAKPEDSGSFFSFDGQRLEY